MITWLKNYFRKEWALIIHLPGQRTILPNGDTIEQSGQEKQYAAKKLIKTDPKHFIWIDLKNRRHELKFLAPVVFHTIRIK